MPQQYIDFAFVKENASFECVIAGYNLRLLGSGAQRSLLCPFHRERKPSCKIDLERKIWHCFGCGAKGNILEFVARMEGDDADLRDASLKIAELCGIATAPPRETSARAAAPQRTQSPQRKRGKRRESPARAPKAQSEPSSDAVATDEAAPANTPLTFELKLERTHPYLAERGLSAELIQQFGLGYCSRGVMARRICIPIHNERGELVAYAGRWPGEPPDEVERYKLPKQFQKSRVLFNLHRLAPGEHVVLVEGYWSAMRLHALGMPVAALMGWSVSTDQLALLRERGIRFVTLLLDGDETGRKGRERVLPDLASAFFVSAPLLAEGQKPDTIDENLLRQLVSLP